VSIVNRGHQVVALRLIGMAEWMMGAKRSDRATVITAPHRIRIQAHQRLALLCTQRDPSGGFGGGTAFLSIDTAPGEREDWTCDRRECFDARGRLVMPERFGQTSGIGLDPCAALSTRITLAPGELTHRVFLMGYAPDAEAATVLLAQADEQAPEQRLAQVRQQWDDLLGTTTVSTPDPLFDAMVNRWLLYQSVSCRLWSKAGFYQAGGATGFRDQLQDAMALVWTAPEMLRQQIVLCASRQFPEGDVQHWWHAPSGAGVRTHFSDDLLWLAHACVHYLHNTGDASLLDEDVPFLEGSTIPPGAEDVYEVPTRSDLSASIYEHAARTIDHSLPVGVHGLPLMGCGDWNDGMNRVGIEGRGESVWLGWFLCQLVSQFAPLAHSRGDHERAHRWEQAAQGWSNALCGPAWDGQWFKRAFFDDGQPLGSHLNSEASIDLIAQAWSVLSNAAPLTQQRMAMAAVEAHLVDHEAGLIKLLDPPLALSMPSAGYIQSYPPGVRENGGQYSHAGVWALMAQAELVRRDPPSTDQDTPYRYFTYLSPAHRAQRPDQGGAYGIEPYVVAGDVYTQAPYVGRGGWSWYSGAAAWLHRAAIESIFGLHWGPEHLSINPCLPSHWPQASLTLKRDGRRLHFTLIRATERDALQTCSDSGAMGPHQLLKPGQLLNWPGLGSDTSLVVPLLA
jgi:cyclic beta-1,2-glucan synthetase